jgi:hypothetical protein
MPGSPGSAGMTTDRLLNILVTITLIEMMVAVGLAVRLADLAVVVKIWRLSGLSTASLSALGYERNLSRPAILLWNETRHVGM